MERVALYLQDSHDLRDGLDYVRYAESMALKRSGRRNRGSCATPSSHGRLRCGHTKNQGRLGRDQ